MNTIITKYFFFFIVFIIFVTDSEARDKNYASHKISSDSVYHEGIIIDTGALQNYVSNSTGVAFHPNLQTFIIGSNDSTRPSMMWSEGGYENNNYLYFGSFFIGYNNNYIRFNTATSNGLLIERINFERNADISVSFSMTDELADPSDKVGIKCICKVLAWHSYDTIDDFLVYEYDIINNSGQLLEDIYAGFHIDGDISSAGGGSGKTAFYRDDQVYYHFITDSSDTTLVMSYMYDDDNYNTSYYDFGGNFDPKESLGYLGSRVIKSLPTKTGVPANRQSNHQWWDWGSDPLDPGWPQDIYNLMKTPEYKVQPGSPHDYRYLQSMGPWDINADDTLSVAIALGIGNGLDGLRQNLQAANDVYWGNDWGPKITYCSPAEPQITTYVGESIKFCIRGEGGQIYRWKLNDYLLSNYDSTYTYTANTFNLGRVVITGTVSNNRFTRGRKWTLNVQRAKRFELKQNYPNPFNGVTTIPFELEKDGNVKIIIYDILGRRMNTLVNKPFTFGKHEITWDGTDKGGNRVSSGFYFYHIISGNFQKAKRLLLLK